MALVTLEEAKLWAHADGDEDDALIQDLIEEAEEYLFEATGRKWPDSKRAKRFILTYVADAYDSRGTDVDSRRTLSRTLQSIMLQLQNTPHDDGDDGP